MDLDLIINGLAQSNRFISPPTLPPWIGQKGRSLSRRYIDLAGLEMISGRIGVALGWAHAARPF